MEESGKSKLNRYVIATLVVLLLFVLPGISWFYLRSGLDYHKKAKSELNDLGKVPEFQLSNQHNLPVNAETLGGRICVISFLPIDDSQAKANVSRIAKVQKSFEDTEEVLFISVFQTGQLDNLLLHANELGIMDHHQWFLLGASTGQWQALANKFQLTDPTTTMVLIDQQSTIRKHYNINLDPEMGRLVEHIAILIPKKRRR